MSRVRALASLQFDGGGVPSYLLRSGSTWAAAITDTAPGNIGLNTGAGSGFDQLASLILSSPRRVAAGAPPAADGLRSMSAVQTTDILKQSYSSEEPGGGGASALADVPYDVVVMDAAAQERSGFALLDAGSIGIAGGLPVYTWRAGMFAGDLGPVAPGDFVWTWARGGLDSATCCCICTPRGVLAASGLRSVQVIHNSDTSKRIASYEEGAVGASSALANVAFDFAIFGLAPALRRPIAQIHALCSVVSGVGPAFRRPISTGQWASLVRSAAGDYDLTLGPAYGVDAAACAVLASPRVVGAASQLRAISVSHTSDTVKRVTLLQEAGGGAASALTDFDFDLAIIRRSRG